VSSDLWLSKVIRSLGNREFIKVDANDLSSALDDIATVKFKPSQTQLFLGLLNIEMMLYFLRLIVIHLK